MTLSPMDKLLAEILDRQDEDGRGAELSEERVRAVLCEGKRLNPAEKYLLATSPLARDTYANVLNEVEIERQACRHRWEHAGIQTSVHTLLAAATAHYPLVIPAKDFSVTVRPHPTRAWSITLKLGEGFLRQIGGRDILALVDHQEVVWASGPVNDYGEITTAGWSSSETPLERTRQRGFSLQVRHA
jgi:hypothetical protein